LAGKVTAGLAESDGSLQPGRWLIGTCRLTACTLGSALNPMIGNKYGKTLPFLPSLISNGKYYYNYFTPQVVKIPGIKNKS